MPIVPRPRTVAALPSNRRLRRRMVVSWLGGECVTCGSTKNLELDHIDCMTKTIKHTDKLFRLRAETVIAELPLLQLLCNSCHIEKSRQDRWLKAGQRPHWEHGTITGYFHSGCRCDLCRDAMREYYRQKKADALDP